MQMRNNEAPVTPEFQGKWFTSFKWCRTLSVEWFRLQRTVSITSFKTGQQGRVGWDLGGGGGAVGRGRGEMLKYCQTCFRDHFPVSTACMSNLTTAQDPPSHQLMGTLQNRPLFYYTAHHNSVNPAVVGNTSKQTSVIYTTHHKSVNPAAVSLKTSRRVQMSTQALKAASSLCRKTRKAARPHSLETTTTPAT